MNSSTFFISLDRNCNMYLHKNLTPGTLFMSLIMDYNKEVFYENVKFSHCADARFNSIYK